MKDIEIQCFSQWKVSFDDDAKELTVSVMDDGKYMLTIPKWAHFSFPQLYNEGDKVLVNGEQGVIDEVCSTSYCVRFNNGDRKRLFTSEIDKKMEE